MTYSCIDGATVKLFADDTHLFDNGQSIDEISAITNICICMSGVRGNMKGKSLHGELTNGKPAGMSYAPFSVRFRSRQFPGPGCTEMLYFFYSPSSYKSVPDVACYV